ncbi:MAG: hypothetical protein HXY21_01335 [Parvularculaceae bacterium]|nr:hypothetical protein [Parvularculaceae bacterium]
MKFVQASVGLLLWAFFAVTGLASFGCPVFGVSVDCPEPWSLAHWAVGFLIGPYIVMRTLMVDWFALSPDAAHLVGAIFFGIFYGGFIGLLSPYMRQQKPGD